MFMVLGFSLNCSPVIIRIKQAIEIALKWIVCLYMEADLPKEWQQLC